MNWQNPARYAQVSECGRYSVCRIGIGDGQFLEAWRTRQHPDGPHLVSTNLKTALDARKACEADDQDNP